VVLTRGLAATADYIVVGRSMLSPRASRADSDGGLWLLDRRTLATLEKVVLEGSGAVREVRILDRVDECPPWATKNVHAARLSATLSRLEIAVGHEIDVAGYVPDADAHRLIAGADALVMPSLAEGGGSFPVEEAPAAGVPVLCSDIPVMREHLHERTARIAWFDPYCPGAITGTPEALFADYGDHKARAVRGTADPRPSWDDVAGRYVAVFRAVVEAGP
jgi:glycosyltransferase involved in cell wall biosynthesis